MKCEAEQRSKHVANTALELWIELDLGLMKHKVTPGLTTQSDVSLL